MGIWTTAWLTAAAAVTCGLVAGCTSEATGVYLGPYPDLPNHTQPFDVAVDPVARRAYSTSLGCRTLSVVDLELRTVATMLPIHTSPVAYPSVVVDDLGTVWVTGRSQPALTRFDGDGFERQYPFNPLLNIGAAVPVPRGGLAALGFQEDGERALVRFDADGEVGQVTAPRGSVSGLIALSGDRLGVMYIDGLDDGLELRDMSTLEATGHCALPFVSDGGAELDDGTVMVYDHTRIGMADCDGSGTASWATGVENMGMVALEDRVLVLDRIGLTAGYDPKFGVAWPADASGVHTDAAFATAKNTGFGALDPDTGLVWANSEGTAEMVALDPAAGEVADAIRLGTFLDGLAVDPDDAGVFYVTGRLSNTFVRIAGGALDAENTDVFWPFSPQVDVARDRIWVLSQTDALVHGHRRSDLQQQVTFDPGLGPNHLLTFGSLAIHPHRDTLLLAESRQDVLIEIDPDTGAILGTWDLGGPVIADRDEIGQLLVLVNRDDSSVLVLRSNDGRVQRLDLDQDLDQTGIDTVWLDGDVVAALADGNAVDFAHLLPEQGLVYLGGLAVDATTLARRSERDLPAVSRIVGLHPTRAGQLVAVDRERRNLVRIDLDGTVRGEATYAGRDLNASVYRVVDDPAGVAMVRSADAYFLHFDIGLLR